MDENEDSAEYLHRMGMQAWGKAFISIGFAIGLISNLIVIWSTYSFYLEVSKLERGSYIHPMGLTILDFAVGIPSILGGLSFLQLGASICRQAGYDQFSKWQRSITLLCIAPLPLGIISVLIIGSLLGLQAG